MSLNIYQGCQEYVRTMIERVSGMKVLILDPETTAIISMLYSQTQILEREVFLVEKIGCSMSERQRHLKAVYFIRPTKENFMKLKQELKNPNFGEYHIFFSNTVPLHELESIAKFDTLELVQQVQEYYCDVYVLSRDLFTLSLPSTTTLSLEGGWTPHEDLAFQRIVDGLFAVTLTLQRRPLIRYQRSSHICHRIAVALQSRIATERILYESCARGGAGENGTQAVLLLCDRREDPLTPLLNQWTYLAMIHELLQLKRNRLTLKDAPNVPKELEEVLMSPELDDFLKDNAHTIFGELPSVVKDYMKQLEDVTKKAKGGNFDDITEMQKLVDSLPEFKKLSMGVQKHVTVLHEISRLVNASSLLEVSALEQDIAAVERRSTHLEKLFEIIKNPTISGYEKLRLAMIFALRYESDPKLSSVKQELISAGVDSAKVGLIESLLAYGGAEQRSASSSLFGGNKGLLQSAKSTIVRGVAGVENIYTQHKSVLAHSLDSLLKGKLKDSSFPFMGVTATAAAAGLAKEKVNEAIIFMVGGVTFEEAKDVQQVSEIMAAASSGIGVSGGSGSLLAGKDGGARVILGGTEVINSRMFLADLNVWKDRALNGGHQTGNGGWSGGSGGYTTVTVE